MAYGTILYSECQKSQRLRTLFKFIVSFFRSMPIIFLFNFFGGLARGPPGARGPQFIELLEPLVATPLTEMNTSTAACFPGACVNWRIWWCREGYMGGERDGVQILQSLD